MKAITMSKHHRIWNIDVYKNYVREGRGCGSNSDYAPWIYVQDFASRGVVSRVKGRTTGRVHHLMSNNELAYFYILDWSDTVTDIREQYPLSDLECAVRVASQAGIKYPTDKVSGYPYVLTCDFMITTADGPKARTIKMAQELNNPRTLEKLEIERRYWLTQNIDWKIVTEQEIPFQKSKNIEWLYSTQDFRVESHEIGQARDMLRELLLYGKHSVIEATQTVEREYPLPFGLGLQLFKNLVLDRMITINLSKPLNLNARGVVS
jgi:hypothetical protein